MRKRNKRDIKSFDKQVMSAGRVSSSNGNSNNLENKDHPLSLANIKPTEEVKEVSERYLINYDNLDSDI
jgi:hypothetical protein